MKFGVLSDIHISHVGAGEKMSDRRNNLTFRHALEWFRSQDVDAMVIAGDLTNNGMDDQLLAVAEAKGGARVVKFLMAEGFNHAPMHPKARTPNVCNFSLDELPKGEVRFVVTPMNCFHARGKSLVSRWMSA